MSKETIDIEKAITDIFFTIDEYGTAQEARMDIRELLNAVRVDELIRIRNIGEAVADTDGSDFHDLADAYDKHILKRLADLTTPEKAE